MFYSTRWDPEQLERLRVELISPYPYDEGGRALLSIDSSDIFNEYLHFQSPEYKAGVSFQTLPSSVVFEEVYKSYCVRRKNRQALPSNASSPARTKPEYGTFKYNGHPAAWRLFDCIVYTYGSDFRLTDLPNVKLHIFVPLLKSDVLILA